MKTVSRLASNGVLWAKYLREARVQLIASTLLIFGLGWLYTWLTSVIDLSSMAGFVDTLPDFLKRMSSISLSRFADPKILISFYFTHPVVLVTVACWAIGRGTDVVSGELDRGTLDLLLGLPLSRIHVLLVASVVMTLGCFVMVVAAFCGMATGVAVATFPRDVSVWNFLPVCINLFGLTFCLCGVATAIGSVGRFRHRAIGVAAGAAILQLIIKLASQMWPDGDWLAYATVLGAYDPPALIAQSKSVWPAALQYTAILMAVGLAAFLVAGAIFQKRDLPATL